MAWAEALPKDGQVVTCEINPAMTEIAKRYFTESPPGSKIEIKLGPALESLSLIHGHFDLCFIDADKENYGAYYDRCMELVRPRGLIILDNMLRAPGACSIRPTGRRGRWMLSTSASATTRGLTMSYCRCGMELWWCGNTSQRFRLARAPASSTSFASLPAAVPSTRVFYQRNPSSSARHGETAV